MTVSWWEVMVSWHSCTFISWEKPRELPHFIFLLLSLMLHDSKLMLKLYYLRVPTSLLTGCDTKVALDSGLSLGAWKQKLTTLNRKKQSVKGRNLLTEMSLTKVLWAPDQWKVNKGKIAIRCSQSSTIAPCWRIQESSWILDPIPWILDSGC